MSDRRIAIYLNDHLAAALGGRELLSRTAASNRGNAYGEALSPLIEEFDGDRAALRDIMTRLDVNPDPLKQAAAWTGEKLGRFKLNGSLVSYSPLSRVEELEVLMVGVQGKLLMWQVLAGVKPVAERLSGVDLDGLIDEARSQWSTLRTLRLRAAREAFS